jgi:hypothetical protein
VLHAPLLDPQRARAGTIDATFVTTARAKNAKRDGSEQLTAMLRLAVVRSLCSAPSVRTRRPGTWR